jgi:peroxiredoxin
MSTYVVVPERPLRVGDEAPNFDLTSTEDVLLMLRDEVPRTAVVLYFFASASEPRAVADLDALSARRAALAELDAKAMAISPASLAELKKLQAERRLGFPLLHDDRGFAKAYGFEPRAEGALYVVDRWQKILWLQNPVGAVAAALPEIEKLLAKTPPPTALYPKKVINRWIARWVN